MNRIEHIIGPIKEKYDVLDVEKSQLIFWGMGNTLSLYMNAIRTEKIEVSAYTDGSAKEGELDGTPVIAHERIGDMFSKPLVVVAVLNVSVISDVYKRLEEFKLQYIGIQDFFIGKNYNRIRHVFSLLCDEKSKEIFCKVLKKRINNDPDFTDIFEGNQYFALPQFSACKDNEIYVDCGAFKGDSMMHYYEYMGRLGDRYYAIEPDDKNFAELEVSVKKLMDSGEIQDGTINTIHAGVSDNCGELFFENKGDAGSKFTDYETEYVMKTISIDSQFEDVPVTVIKADVETYEPLLLRGAVNVIRKYRPNLAICIYHNISDLYTVIDYVASLDLGYKIYVRHHSSCEYETVMYATCDDE